MLLLGEPAALGRSFAFAIQALGMSSAVLYLLAAGRPLAWGVLRWALLGSLLATPIGVVWLAPRVPELGVKLVYAVVWARLRRDHAAPALRARGPDRACSTLGPGSERAAGLLAGAIGGGCIASVAGVGADMLLYSVLVLLFRADAAARHPDGRRADGVHLARGRRDQRAASRLLDPSVPLLHPGVAEHWLAAAPVVVVGAPLGALAVSVIPRTATLALVALLCLAQLVWTCAQARALAGRHRVGGGGGARPRRLLELLHAQVARRARPAR